MSAPKRRVMLDTNPLVYSVNKDAKDHRYWREFFEKIASGRSDVTYYLPEQARKEFYATVTHPKKLKNPYTPDQARKALRAFKALPGVVTLGDARDEWADIAVARNLVGTRVFDAGIVAEMRRNGITEVCTCDGHFDGFDGITVVKA
jgi:predicted nucleic acid-binding protein